MMIYPSKVDWVRIASDVVLDLLGEPTVKKPNEWRYGNKGSLVFKPDAGTWWDFENDTGGGISDLIKHMGRDVNEILKKYGYDTAPLDNSLLKTPPKKSSGAKSFTRLEMRELHAQAIISLQYSPEFFVMRFPTSHPIKQKYAPFSRNEDGTWSMKRPEGLMPIYFKNEYPDKPIVINEGEKATVGCEQIYKGDAVTWHGGVNAWNKSDWSPIFGKEIVIFPDNDDAGKKCANELHEYLRANGCKVKVIEPPKEFNDKDDLYDAYESKYFTSSEDFEKFIYNQKEKLPRGALRFQTVKEAILTVENPKWLIEDVFEQEKLITVFGEPKSGKSFIAIAMASAVATGSSFYGCKANKANVLYLAGEGLSGMRRRLLAMHQSEYGHKLFYTDEEKQANPELEDANLFLSNRGTRINEPEEFEKLENEINLIKQEKGDIGLIIFDTFQRNFSGDENSAQEVNKFVKAADQLIHDYKCTVLLVHHTGRGNTNRARGSSVLDASIDGEFLVKRKDQNEEMFVTMKQTKNKDGMGITEKKFKFHEEHLIGAGYEVTSGLLIETDEKIMTSKEIDNITDERIMNLMRFMALEKANPRDVFFTAGSFGHNGVYNISGKEISRDNINNSFKRLLKNGIIERKRNVTGNKKDQGYRLVDLEEGV